MHRGIYDEIENIFNKYDENKDGFITKEELTKEVSPL